MTLLVQPFLRSPPFPGVTSNQAAVSKLRILGEAAPVAGDDILDAIAANRVGGMFWGPQYRGHALVARDGVTVPAEVTSRFARGEAEIFRVVCPCDPWALMESAQSVHADVDDELAIVAGLADVPVFGRDQQQIDPALLRDAARAALGAAVYRDCFSGQDASIEEVVGLLGDWRRHLDKNKGLAAAVGMAFWKKDAIRRLLWDGQASPPLVSARKGLRLAEKTGRALAVWPSRVDAAVGTAARERDIPVVRIEDGFLRSRGLGAGLHPPGSIVVDRSGLYYDARHTSDLELLLSKCPFPSSLELRAKRLRERLCQKGVTKYGQASGKPIDLPPGRRTVLAVGQVDDDLSVSFGGAGVEGNHDFLARVRRAEPDAWIIYRPHPDVQAGHRRGHLSNAAVLQHADAIDPGSPLMALVMAVDEVHVLSSLTGFEALMRGCSVTVHGMPFYAGWGLTRDLAAPTGRRHRRLTIDQLVAGALILYPQYLDPVTGLPCGPELMVERMAGDAMPAATSLIRLRALQGKLRRFMTLFVEFFRG